MNDIFDLFGELFSKNLEEHYEEFGLRPTTDAEKRERDALLAEWDLTDEEKETK